MSSFMPWVLVQAFLIMKVKLCALAQVYHFWGKN